tara:strand:+ start:809 stop:1135 length:327 start_codon:yes stop_codon:yes gene_type:complete
MAQIIRRKEDNMVLFLLDDLDVVTLDSEDGLTLNLCSTPKSQTDLLGQQITDALFEIVTGITQPNLPHRFYGQEVDKWDGTTWTQDADALVLFRANDTWQEPQPHNLI